MNIADMAQKFLALLMMIPWFRFARFYVLEAADLAAYLSSLAARATAYLILDKTQPTPPTLLIPRNTGDFIFRFTERRPRRSYWLAL